MHLMNDTISVTDWDARDPLADFRNRFFSESQEVYLDGNSLGKMPLEAQATVQRVLQQQWGQGLIRSWNEQWLDLPPRIAGKYAQLLGTNPANIIIGESTSVRLYQIVHALLNTHKYTRLITDNLNFPTDLYILEGLEKAFELPQTLVVDYGQELEADIAKLKAEIQKQPSIVCLSLVSYKSAYLYPMAELNRWAQAHDSIIVWDLSHAVGIVPIAFEATQTKAAIGCTYKFMNGGPGAPAFMYIGESLQKELANPIQGWFGHAKPFDFSTSYKAAEGIHRFASGTPQILSLAAMEAGVDITLEAGIEAIRKKSIQQTDYLISTFQKELMPYGFELFSPQKSINRGSHISLTHPQAWQICQALQQGMEGYPQVIPDFRPPQIIRLGVAPLYTSFADLMLAVKYLKAIVEHQWHIKYPTDKPQVT